MKAFFNHNFDLSVIYSNIYEYVYVLCDYSFNYCPTHYQMLYFYFPIFYLYVRSKNKKKLFNSTEMSTLNYIFTVFYRFCLNFKNVNFASFVLVVFFKKLYLFLKTIFLKTLGFRKTLIVKEVKKNHPWLTWKPVFKKFSYFGLFAFIRSKWYKNK